jgi:type I restriction enzyme S subunit
MSAVHKLITDHLDIWTTADTEKKSGRGRASGNTNSVYGIKKLRELILELAVRGKLVPQDPNDEPASELLKRIQDEKAKLIAEGKIKKDKPLTAITDEEKPFELPSGWIFSRLNDVFDVRDGTHDSPKFLDVGYPFVTSKNLYTGKLDISDVKYVSEEDHRKFSIRSNVQRGDILFAMIGSIGNPAIVETDIEFSIKNVALIKPYQHKLNNAHYLLLNLKASTEKMKSEAGGGVQSFISLGNLRKHAIAVPPLAEQHRIVAKVDELMALCDHLEAQHNNAADAHEQLVSHLLSTLTQSQDAADFNANWQRIATHFDTLFTTESSIDALKQTLLQLAVMGKLVPQDPNDEPASELLKRIQVEKAKLVAEGKIKKDKPLSAVGEIEKAFDLPKNWEWARMIDCSKQITDGEHLTPERTTDSNQIPLVTAKNVRDGSMDYTNTDYVEIEVAKKCWTRCKPESNDILVVSVGATIGRLTVVENHRDMVIVRSVTLVKPLLIYNHYLAMTLRSPLLQQSIWSGVKQNAQPCLYLSVSNSLPIPLPPLEEQIRIVTKVNELMNLCEQLKSRITDAKKSQQKLADVLVEESLVK